MRWNENERNPIKRSKDEEERLVYRNEIQNCNLLVTLMDKRTEVEYNSVEHKRHCTPVGLHTLVVSRCVDCEDSNGTWSALLFLVSESTTKNIIAC